MRNKDGSFQHNISTQNMGAAVAAELEYQVDGESGPDNSDLVGYDHRVDRYMRFMARIQPEVLHAPIEVLRNRATGWYIENYTQAKI